MSSSPTILLIGTADTKSDELRFMAQCISDGGGHVLIMDVGLLDAPSGMAIAFSNQQVAQAGGHALHAVVAMAAHGDENHAMKAMADGAVDIALHLYAQGRVQGVLALGGTMGTDLALDVTAALPLGLPKIIVTTVAFSHLIPPERLAPDLMMMLWAGGLYGLNSICQSILAQASGAVLGAARGTVALQTERPVVAISSLGKSCLRYMLTLKPALEARGYEVAVFHCTGMGGRALESLAAQGRFAAVLDLCLQEVGNEAHGSVVTSGADRLEAAGRAAVPQIVAPGGIDMIDLQTWKPLPAAYEGRPYHAHNRLIASVSMTPDERRAAARIVAQKLALARGPTAFVLPNQGIQAWDKPGEALHDPAGLQAFCDEIRHSVHAPAELIEVDAHINDAAFSDAVLAVFDRWVLTGHIRPGKPGALT